MKKIKIGVFGAGRGTGVAKYCTIANNAELVAICDRDTARLERKRKELPEDIVFYTDFEDFIKHDMDAVILANYANEHAPYAIRCMKAGKHVFSEVLPVQTLKEAVELVEAVEETGMTYAYAENYCYMPAPYEMKRLYREGKIGSFEYAEAEYIHNCGPIWYGITQEGDPKHWRNNMYANFYCTHSIGPILHITGLRPVSVVGFEGNLNERGLSNGNRSGSFGIEMIRLENGGLIKSIHGDLYENSVWYSMYGSKGRMESLREDIDVNGVETILVKADDYPGQYKKDNVLSYKPKIHDSETAKDFGHGGSDYYSTYNFIEKLQGNPDADIIDVYEALDMFLPGLLAYRSVLAGGIPMDIPNFRNPEEREKYRNDTACTDPKVAGDMLIPSYSKGNPDIPDSVYEALRQKAMAEEAKKKEADKKA